MREYREDQPFGGGSGGEVAGPALRVIGSLLGLFILLLGLYFSVRLFNGIYQAVESPASLEKTFDEWGKIAGGEDLKVTIGGQPVVISRLVGIAGVGAGAFLLCRLAIAIMIAGSRIISWSTGDREAVKKIIREAMGGQAKT